MIRKCYGIILALMASKDVYCFQTRSVASSWDIMLKSPPRKPSAVRHETSVFLGSLSPSNDEITAVPSSSAKTPLSLSAKIESAIQACLLIVASLSFAIGLIAWEEVSTTHPMRAYVAKNGQFKSTTGGMAFGALERQKVTLDMEPEQLRSIPSYNEVMLKHRQNRVSTWKTDISREDVELSVRSLQQALIHINECKALASDYKWDELAKSIREPVVGQQLDEACDILNRASDFLSLETRMEIGFDFGSCAWRHCGAFADVREALDELDHLIGILEPFEAAFILDVVERGLRDMLAVTTEFQDTSIPVPEYQMFQRKSDLNEDVDGALDADYLAALELLKRIDDEQ